MTSSTRQYIYKRTAYFYNWILNGPSGQYAREYLAYRGISLSMANNFLIGATPAGNNGFNTNVLMKELLDNVDFVDVAESKLARLHKSEHEFELVDYFSAYKLIFPIMDHGKPSHFIGRSVKPEDRIRFMNMKGISLGGLFNQDVLRMPVEEIYVTEGIMDALTVESMGYPAIATMGTAGITPSHRNLFDGVNKKFVFVFDNDENGSGDKAVLKSASVLKSFGIESISKIVLPRKSEDGNSLKKVDINQLLMRAGNADALKAWFNDRERQIVHVEPYQKKIGNGNNYNDADKIEVYKVVSRYVSLKQVSPVLYRGMCPLHDDNDPSLHIYTETNTFKCFGCGKWGDAAQFLQYLQGLSYSDALEKIKADF